MSVRAPWSRDAERATGRARWRLDTYGGERAATRLLPLLDEWRNVRAAGRTQLTITAITNTDPLRLRFGWKRP